MIEGLAESRVSELLDIWPNFSMISKDDGGIVVEGDYALNAEYNEIPIAENYRLQVIIPPSFPNKVPVVFEISGLIPSDYEHKYLAGNLCLGINGEIIESLSKNDSLVQFFETYIRDALFSANYFCRYGEYPFGDRSHGSSGILSYYAELFDVDEEAARRILDTISQRSYRGHLPCPCGSSKIGRKCHGAVILEIIHDSPRFTAVQQDVEKIIEYQFAEQKRRENTFNSKCGQLLNIKKRTGGIPMMSPMLV